MRLSHKLRLFLFTFFSILLAINMIFFIVLRLDAFFTYREVLMIIKEFLGWLGIATTVDVLEAYLVLIGFLTSISAASILFYLGLQIFRTQEVIHKTLHERVQKPISQQKQDNSN